MLKRRFKRTKRVGHGGPDPQTTSHYHDKKISEIYTRVQSFKNPKQLADVGLFDFTVFTNSFAKLYHDLRLNRKFVEHFIECETDSPEKKGWRNEINHELKRLGYDIQNCVSIIIRV